MATTSLQAESACANPETSYALYSAWRFAKAQWDCFIYDPARATDEAEERDSELCGISCDALNRYLLHPADDIADLARKLRVCHEEDIFESWVKAPEIAAVLAADGKRLAFGKYA